MAQEELQESKLTKAGGRKPTHGCNYPMVGWPSVILTPMGPSLNLTREGTSRPSLRSSLSLSTHCSALRPVAASCGLGQFGYTNSPWWYCKPWNNRIWKGCASSAQNVSCNITGTWALVHNAAHCGLLRPRVAKANLVITTHLGGIASIGTIKLGRVVLQVPEMSPAI